MARKNLLADSNQFSLAFDPFLGLVNSNFRHLETRSETQSANPNRAYQNDLQIVKNTIGSADQSGNLLDHPLTMITKQGLIPTLYSL